MLNSVLTARLILNLRDASPVNSNNTVQQTQRSARWEMRAIDKIADDFDDAPLSPEEHMLDSVRRIKAQK